MCPAEDTIITSSLGHGWLATSDLIFFFLCDESYCSFLIAFLFI